MAGRSNRTLTRAPSRTQSESPQHQQRPLAKRSTCGEDAQLRGGAVEVEEGSDAQQPLVTELAVEDAVNDDEAVGRREPLERGLVRRQQLAGGRDEPVVCEPLAGSLDPRVRESRPQSFGVAAQLLRA